MEARITPEATHGVTSSPGFPAASPGLVLSPGAHHHLSPGGRSPTVHQGTTAGWDHDRPEGRNRETPPHSCPLRSQPLQPPQPAALRSPQMQTKIQCSQCRGSQGSIPGQGTKILYLTTKSLQNTGVGSLSLLQGIFPTRGSNPGLLHCRQIPNHWTTRKMR